jgi:hypothetical protein
MRFVIAVLIGLGTASAAVAGDCASLIQSVCGADAPGNTAQPRRVLKVATRPPEFAKGDHFPVEDRSVLMNPTRYRLPKVDSNWRYYAKDGVVYRVEVATATVLEVINDNRTWSLR